MHLFDPQVIKAWLLVLLWLVLFCGIVAAGVALFLKASRQQGKRPKGVNRSTAE
jgi:Na+-transporting NADH:ubiquinone oxidoreductase subunit NqrC